MKLLLYLGIIVLVVPAWGLMVTGSWRAAWRYSKDWLRVMGLLLAAGGAVALVVAAWELMV